MTRWTPTPVAAAIVLVALAPSASIGQAPEPAAHATVALSAPLARVLTWR